MSRVEFKNGNKAYAIYVWDYTNLFPTKDGLKPVVYCGPFFVITNEKLEIDSICELMSKRTRKDSKNYKLKAEAIEITNLQMSNLLFK